MPPLGEHQSWRGVHHQSVSALLQTGPSATVDLPFSACTAASCCDCKFRKEWNEYCVSYNWCLIQHEFLLKLFLQLDIHNPKPLLRQRQCERFPATLPYAFRIRTAWYLWALCFSPEFVLTLSPSSKQMSAGKPAQVICSYMYPDLEWPQLTEERGSAQTVQD